MGDCYNNIATSGSHEGLHVNAQEFYMPSRNMVPCTTTQSRGVQTELNEALKSSSMQTDKCDKKTTNMGIQCKSEMRNIGVKCQLDQRGIVKHRFVQATPPIVSQGVSAIVKHINVATQSNTLGDGPCKADAATMCIQSPGATSRHIQTHKIKLVDAKTNTTLPQTHTVATNSTDYDCGYNGDLEIETAGDWGNPIEGLLDPPFDVDSETEQLNGEWKVDVEGDLEQDRKQLENEWNTPKSDQKTVFMGKNGLPDFLDHLGVTIVDTGQYNELIQNEYLNRNINYIIQSKKSYQLFDKVLVSCIYYTILDDFVVMITVNNGGEYSMATYTK
jgi:hypothetical protein